MKVLIAVLYLLSASCLLPGKSLELSLGLDGAGQFRGGSLFTGIGFSTSASCTWSADHIPEAVAGFNNPIFSIGHLGDSGLAAEVRNPDFTALSRLSEKTFCRADLRSESFSRLGLALMLENARGGVVWERRKSIDAGIIWALPLSTETWLIEILGEAGILRTASADEKWYPEDSPAVSGPVALLSCRIRQSAVRERSGLTLIFSGGSNFRPGWLAALSSNYASGPWRLRGRAVYSSVYFRNADGEQLEYPAGLGIDWRFRPSAGLQFTIDYEAGWGRGYADKGSAALGWRFGEVQLSIESDWSRLFLNSYPVEGSPCSSIKGRITWDRNYLHLGVMGKMKPGEGWYFRLSAAFPAHGRWSLEPSAELHSTGTVLLLDLRFKYLWKIGDHKLILSILAADMGRDWEQGPQSAGDFEMEIRWIQRFH